MSKHVILALADAELGTSLEKAVLRPAGFDVTFISEARAIEKLVKSTPPDVIIIGDKLKDGNGMKLAAEFFEELPYLPMILLASEHTQDLATQAIKIGFTDYLTQPVDTDAVLDAVQHALKRREHLERWTHLESRRNTKSLRKQLSDLETLQSVARTVTASLDLDCVLTTVVDAAVDLTGAEEGSLLLLDESSGELYMRAGRNFQDEFVRTFRLPIRDTLAGQVLRTGEPLTLDEKTPQKIKTAYLVHTLIYVPLQVHGRVIGVLGVDNRESGHPFTKTHVSLVSALADYAAIAIENARLFSHSEIERNKLEMILTQIEDGVIVAGHDRRLILVNHAAQVAFDLEENSLYGKPARDAFQHPELLEIFGADKIQPRRTEINIDDGRVFNAQVTPIPDVGLAVTMQDITHLKELDRIKSDFVNTVSHDLRSPLTAILGYVELIARAGPITSQQREFIDKVQISVNNITILINDLLDLGRIEAGFDARKEIVHFPTLIQYATESLRKRISEKDQDVIVGVSEDLPTVLGNPARLRRMVSNLLNNAVTFTPQNGEIQIHIEAAGEQIILQIIDTGPGIPPSDQPNIFDKFYRGSNVPYDTPGTGLGLAIVKSIVENHQGRIWVDSTVGQGTTFTVVLPITDQEL